MPTKQDLATYLGVLCGISDKRPDLLYESSPKNKQRLLVSFKSLMSVVMTLDRAQSSVMSSILHLFSKASKI